MASVAVPPVRVIQHEPHAMMDLTGTSLGPLLGARELLGALAEGQVLLLLTDCAGARDDLFAWARQTGNEVIHTEPRARGATGFYLRKGRAGAVTAQARLDLRGALCPGPIVEAKRLLDGMRPGEVLELVSDCPGVRDDLFGWSAATGVQIVACIEHAAGVYAFYVRRP